MARILVVDDEDYIRFTLQEILEEAGHEISVAEHGGKAIEQQQAQPFDLIITDIIMPEKEGIETIIELKNQFPDLKIISISGGGRNQNMDFLKFSKKFGVEKTIA